MLVVEVDRVLRDVTSWTAGSIDAALCTGLHINSAAQAAFDH